MTARLVQLLLPLEDNEGRPFPPALYAELRHTLVARFGGATAYVRAPAEGVWAPAPGAVTHDRVVLVEVMDPAYDTAWWRACRITLERVMRQQSIVVRALPMEQP